MERRRRTLPCRCDEILGVQRRAQRIERHDVVVADHQTRVRGALVHHARAAALDIGVDVGREHAQLALPTGHLRESPGGRFRNAALRPSTEAIPTSPATRPII